MDLRFSDSGMGHRPWEGTASHRRVPRVHRVRRHDEGELAGAEGGDRGVVEVGVAEDAAEQARHCADDGQGPGGGVHVEGQYAAPLWAQRRREASGGGEGEQRVRVCACAHVCTCICVCAWVCVQ